MIVFKNPGEIDPETIRSMGVSVKSESAIGFFGTGLKYALAILLRTGHDIKIHSGLQTYRFGIKRKAIRDKEFEFVTMNDEQLGYTTELGKTWLPWMAYRELYCNALDEQGQVEEHATEPIPRASETLVIVRGQVISQEHANREESFLIGRSPLFGVDGIEVYDGPSPYIYYRGVRVHNLSRVSKFTYNILPHTELVEDRTLKNSWAAESAVAKAISGCKITSFLRAAILTGENYFEHHVGLAYQIHSQEFKEIALQEYKLNPLAVNKSISDWVRTLPPCVVYGRTDAALTRVQQSMLDKAKAFVAHIGFDHSPYHIRVVETLGPSVAATALRDHAEIVIAKTVFEKGTKFVASTLLEEIIHLRESLDDETRAMQTYLFDKIISLGEELAGEPI